MANFDVGVDDPLFEVPPSKITLSDNEWRKNLELPKIFGDFLFRYFGGDRNRRKFTVLLYDGENIWRMILSFRKGRNEAVEHGRGFFQGKEWWEFSRKHGLREGDIVEFNHLRWERDFFDEETVRVINHNLLVLAVSAERNGVDLF